MMLPDNYPSEWIEEVTLKDGMRVLIRPVRPDDAPRLQYAFSRLSSQSIYLRFLETFRELPDGQAQAFATVDYATRMALVGVIQEEGEDRLVISARYSMIGIQEPGVAEAAIVVRDDYQRRGLGKIAMNRLTRYAARHGVHTFLATVHLSNSRILQFIRSSGLLFDRKMLEPGIWEIRIHLPAPK